MQIEDDGDDKQPSLEELKQRYKWCQCPCDPTQYGGFDRYYLHLETHESAWQEPVEPYWLFDTETQDPYANGLQQPLSQSPAVPADEPDPEYSGYNPAIHGNYDPNAPYAQYHNRKREQEQSSGQSRALTDNPQALAAQTTVAGTFNRFTGRFQGDEKSAERHNDYNKSSRQMSAYFDVDAAANAHDGRSLKEERRNEKLSKKQIKELAERRRQKKEKKRLDFYKN